MKFTLTGSLGNTSKPLAEKLIQAGHSVTVISSSGEKAGAIEELGAKAAIGSIEDLDFLIGAFREADGVYTMIPPNFKEPRFREYYGRIAKNYAAALQAAQVRKVVNLSSIGADLTEGTGPIAGLHDVEQILNSLEGLDVVHLRAGYFYLNFFNSMDMVRNMNIIGGNQGAEMDLLMVHPNDIAVAAFEAFQHGFSGKKVEYIVSDRRTFADVAAVLGKAIGKPDLKWVEFTDQQSQEGMAKAGMPEPFPALFTEMGAALRSGKLSQDFDKTHATIQGQIKLEEFAVEFAGKY